MCKFFFIIEIRWLYTPTVQLSITSAIANCELRIVRSDIPKLWVLSPTASPALLSSFNVNQKSGWLPGVYFLGDALRTAIVAIHQLPQTPETLWLRILGRGSVQSQAIVELSALPLNHPYKQATLELVYNLRENLRINQNLESDDRELIINKQSRFSTRGEAPTLQFKIQNYQFKIKTEQ